MSVSFYPLFIFTRLSSYPAIPFFKPSLSYSFYAPFYLHLSFVINFSFSLSPSCYIEFSLLLRSIVDEHKKKLLISFIVNN